jgi:hypothetical protein
MKPFDLPLDNLDRLHAALCPPAEVRKSYLTNPPDDVDHGHVDVILERRNTAITPQTGVLRLSTV